MAEERLGANFTIDTSNLKAGLAEANRMIRESESQFKAAAAGMDDWQSSTEGVSARINHLNNATDLQRKKIDALQSEYQRLINSGLDPTSKQASDLRIQINKETEALNKNEKELKQQTKALDSLGDETKKAAKNTDDLGKSAKESSDGFTVMKGAIAGVIANGISALISKVGEAAKALFSLAESTREYREDTSRLSAAFEGAGFSAESAENAYTKLYRAIGETDTAVEASQQIALLANSEEEVAKWAELATGVVATFGDALKPETFFEAANETIKLGEATGAFTQMLEGTGVDVEKFNKGLEACTTEEEKQNYMLQVSEKALGSAGKAYEETAGSILDAREATAKLEQAQADLGAAVEPLTTKFTELKTSILEELSPALNEIIDDLTDVFDGVQGAPERLANSISSMLDGIISKIVEYIPMVGEFATQLIFMFAQVLIENLPSIVDAVIQMVGIFLKTLGDMAPSLIATIVDAVILIAHTLIDNIDMIIDAGIQLLLGLVEGIVEAIPTLIAQIPIIIQKLVDALINNIPKLIQAAIQLVNGLAQGLIKAIPELIKAIPQIISALVQGLLVEGIPMLIEAGAQLIAGLFQGMLNPANWWNFLVSLVDSIIGGFKSLFGIHSPSRVMRDKIGSYLGEGMALGIADGFDDQIKGVNNAIVKSIDNNLNVGVNNQAKSSNGQVASANNPVVINQYNTYSQAHSRYELWKSKQATAAAVRLAVGGQS